MAGGPDGLVSRWDLEHALGGDRRHSCHEKRGDGENESSDFHDDPDEVKELDPRHPCSVANIPCPQWRPGGELATLIVNGTTPL
jgi:hypothetical protein